MTAAPAALASADASTAVDPELRRALLLTLGLLDTGPEVAFDGLTVAATAATACPVAALSVVDRERLWFKSRQGPNAEDTLRDSAIFGAAAHEPGLLEVTDLLIDTRFRGLAGPTPSLRYYAGAPVRVEGMVVGTLCVADRLPRPPLGEAARAALLGLASAAEALLAARRPIGESHARALRRRQELLSRMSHEMRTPLNAVLGFSQLLASDEDLAGHTRAGVWVGQIEKASAHLLALVDEMLELARLESGRQRLSLRRLDLPRVVRDCTDMLSPQAAASDVKLMLRHHDTGGEWDVTGDDRAVRQILINLIGNAIQHSPRGGTVELRLLAQGARRGVAVSDHGAGIAPDDMPRLFQPFERLDVSSPGTGLGLAISRQLAETLHGAIQVQSELGVGSTFTLQLPAAAPVG